MKAFFKKYSLQLQALKIIFLLIWAILKFYQFNQKNRGMDLVGGVVIAVLLIITIYDFYEKNKKVKEEKRKTQNLYE